MPTEDEELSSATFMLVAVVGRARLRLEKNGLLDLYRALDWARRTDYRILAYIPQLWLAEAELMTGETLRTLGTAQKVLKLLTPSGDPWGKAIALRLSAEALWQAKAPNWPQVEANLVQSTILLRQIRARPDLARVYLLLRRLYDRAGRSAWAIDCHYRATQLFEELNMIEELREAQGQPEVGTITPAISHQVELVGPHWRPESA